MNIQPRLALINIEKYQYQFSVPDANFCVMV